MTDQDLELGIQQSAKLALQQERKTQEERERVLLQKNKKLQDKMEESSMPQSALKLRPINQGTQEKQRLNRDMILQLSRTLRSTHQPNPFALTFQMQRSNPPVDEELDKKLRATAKVMQVRQLTKITHLKHIAAELATDQRQHAAIEHSHMPPTPRPHRF